MLKTLKPKDVDDDQVLAEDDAGAILRYGAVGKLENQWRNKLPIRSLVVLLCANTVAHLEAYIGLHAAGHVVLLLPQSIHEASLVDLLNRYQVEVLVKSGADDEIEVTRLRAPSGDLHRDLSVCMSTSGSTGSPKLVRYSDAALCANARAIQQYLEIDADESAMAHMPMEYSFGLSVIHSHMAAGAKLLLSEQSIMQKLFWERMKQATSLAGVPFHFEMLLRMGLEKADLPRLRYLAQAGGHFPAKLVRRVYDIAVQRGWKFHIMYGQTEAGPRISWLRHDLVPLYPDCIGEAIPGVSMKAADGELIVVSPSIMMGYAMTRSDLVLGDEMGQRLATGDLVEEVDPGIYRITGRKSRFVKVQGNRVSLQDIEMRLHNAGFEVFCVGADDKLSICVTDGDLADIRSVAVSLFSFPPRSVNVRQINKVPRRSNGKVDYAALTQHVLEDAS